MASRRYSLLIGCSLWLLVMSDPIRVPIENELDLHAFAPADIPSVVDEYVRAACEVGLLHVRIVHGRGRGVQRATVQRVLEAH